MKKIFLIFLWLLLGCGSLAITHASIAYFSSQGRAPFIVEKLPLTSEELYVWSLRIHVAAAALALPGCLILSLNVVVKRWRRFHRWCGRLVGAFVLLFLVPSGFYLSFFARGGWRSTLGFILSGVIVMVAMIRSIHSARLKRYQEHRRFTLHVLGQLSVAVTSRVMLYFLNDTNLNPDFVYILSLWIPVIGTYELIELREKGFYEKTHHFFSRLRLFSPRLS